MARVNTSHSLNVGYARSTIARAGGPLVRNLELRGLAVQGASKQRLRQAPQRIDTGNLINSIQVRTYYQGGFPVVRIGTDVEYSIYVHEGTVYMEPNPFLRDGLIQGMRQFLD